MYASLSTRMIVVLTLCIGFLALPSRGDDDAAAESSLPTERADDVADVPVVDLHAKGDPHKRFVLIGYDEQEKVPKEGYGLIVILPGGTGDIGFHAFCKLIHKNAVPEGFSDGATRVASVDGVVGEEPRLADGEE